MPATYAHYRFGKQVLPALSADVRQCIQRFRRMYDAGLQGPDIFFYHNYFTMTPVRELGNSIHSQKGTEFFARACAGADSEAAQAYLYGLLAHYCLDSACHPFINQMQTIGEARHISLEAEFERHLLQKDGLVPPHTQDLSGRIKLTRGECMTVAAFYPEASGADISRCTKGMAFALKFFSGPNREKRARLLRKLKPDLLEHMVPAEPVEDYAFMVGELQDAYEQAAKSFPLLLAGLRNHQKNGEPLGEGFEAVFG